MAENHRDKTKTSILSVKNFTYDKKNVCTQKDAGLRNNSDNLVGRAGHNMRTSGELVYFFGWPLTTERPKRSCFTLLFS